MRRAGVAVGALCASLFAAGAASANGLEIPTNGTEPLGRGDAWLARATDPIATFYNPAALARNGSGVSINVNLIWQKNCFDRRGPGDQAVLAGTGQEAYGRVCNSNSGTPFPDPQIAIQYRVSDKLGIGLALLGPSAYGKVTYPDTTTNYSVGRDNYGAEVQGPSGTRYILRNTSNLLLWPTLGVGYQVLPNLRLGVGLVWGIASLSFSTMSLGVATQQSLNAKNQLIEGGTADAAASIKAHDYFVPGFTASALYTLGENVDLAAWYHWSDAIRASGEANITAYFYDSKLHQNAAPSHTSTPAGMTNVTAQQPMEAKLGVRFFQMRSGAMPTNKKDPMRDELFDVEIDGEWSHDSQFDSIGVHFLGTPPVAQASSGGGAPVAVALPSDATTPHNWKDSFGVRFGGDYNLVPSKVALRAGAWFQSTSFDPKFVFTDFVPATRVGLSLGGTYRAGPVDVQVGYSHVFYVPVDNHGEGGLHAVSGDASTNPPNRSSYAVNGGVLTSAANIASFGGVYRF